MKETNKRYETPKVEVIEIEPQGILCASGGGDDATGFGAGTTNMIIQEFV